MVRKVRSATGRRMAAFPDPVTHTHLACCCIPERDTKVAHFRSLLSDISLLGLLVSRIGSNTIRDGEWVPPGPEVRYPIIYPWKTINNFNIIVPFYQQVVVYLDSTLFGKEKKQESISIHLSTYSFFLSTSIYGTAMW